MNFKEDYEKFIKENEELLSLKTEKAKRDYFLVTLCIKNKNKKAFEELVQRYKKPLHHFISKKIRIKEDTEELVSITFIKVYKNIDSFKINTANFNTWLYRIANNVCIDFIRGKSIKKEFYLLDLKTATQEDHSENSDYEIEDKSADIESNFDKKEKSNFILSLVEQLSEIHKELIIKKYYEGLKYEEISLVMKIPIHTVKSQLRFARLALKEKLK